MGLSGLNPYEDGDGPCIKIRKEKFAEFDRLKAAGGINAVIETVERDALAGPQADSQR